MFEETIVDGGNYVAVSCRNYQDFDSGICCNGEHFAKMGEKVDRNVRGKFFLITGSSSPYALPKEVSINCVRLNDAMSK